MSRRTSQIGSRRTKRKMIDVAFLLENPLFKSTVSARDGIPYII